MTKTFTVGGIPVRVRRSKGRYLRLKIDGATAEVTAFVPDGMRPEDAVRFTTARLGWIQTARGRILSALQASALAEDEIRLFGEVYTVVPFRGKASFVRGRTVFLAVRSDSPAAYRRALAAFERERLTRYLESALPVLIGQTGLAPSEWNVRSMKTRWGSCYVVTKKITFNLGLSRKPTACIDYVVLHELAHLLYPDHGERFKAYLTARMPDWKTRKKLLNGV